jgi:hypothetical protein
MGADGLLFRSIMIHCFRDEIPTDGIVDLDINVSRSDRHQSRFAIVGIVEQRPVIRQWQIESEEVFDASRPSVSGSNPFSP